MAEVETFEEPSPERHRGRTVAKWVGGIVVGLIALVAILLVAINTQPGRRLVADQINALELESGLRIGIGRIDGSIYGAMVIRDLTLSDPDGVFLAAPRVELDYRPFAYLRNHIDIRAAVIPQARLMRMPELLPTTSDPDAPLLPDLDIDVGRLEVGRLIVDPPVTGQRHLVSLNGNAKIADGRAQLSADARALVGEGIAGGDRFTLRLDAVPDEDRFDLAARLAAPTGGLVAGMAGLDAPLTMNVDGRGTWANWQGRAQAALGGEALANLSVTGRDGTFSVTGPLNPGLMMEGPVQRLTAPLVQTNLVATLADRRADIRLRMQSQALAIAAEGQVDLGQSQFRDFRLAARLLQPGAIAPNLNGRDVRLGLLLNGAFGTPLVAYDLQAAAIGFDETIVEGLRAQGRAKVDADRISVPIVARAARISGLNPAVGGLLTNVAINSNLNIAGATILSDNLRIRSDRLNATAVIVADMEKGVYRAGLQGRIDNYLIEGIGLLDITSDIDVIAQGESFGLQGRIAIRTRRIDNESARDFLGGNAIITAGVGMSPEGVVTVRNLRVNAPQFRITDGGGTYTLDGGLNLRAQAVSTAYGPIAVTITGTVARPLVRIAAARPGFGVGLRDVRAEIRGTGTGYAVTASGETDYGPFTADILILSGSGPLTIDVRRVTFAGIDFAGRIVQSPAGPFVGTLTLAGSGLDGTVRLSALGSVQRADIAARANGARIPGEVPITLQRGLVQATAILYPDAPQITGDIQLAGLRRDQTLVETARARVDYRGGAGRAQIVANGRSGVPFRIASNVALSPDLIRVAADGNVNAIPFRLARLAEVRRTAAGWQLAPATIVLPQGNVRIAGRYGDGLVAQARMDRLDLSILNAFSPGLGLGGRATGSVDFIQPADGSFPRADARLEIADFTRSGIATISTPVNMAFSGQLRPEGGAANAVIRRRGAVIGRMQARLQPLSPAAGSWTERLLASPLAGGIRYNGPAEVLWSLSGIAGRQLSGPIGIAADFGGRVSAPQLTGVIRANALTFEDETFGTRITNIALQGRFTSDRFEITELTGQAGSGTISGQGRVGLAADAGFPIDVRVTMDRAQLARSDSIEATVSGNIAVTNGLGRPALIAGDLRLPQVRYEIVRQGAAEVAELEGVRRRGEPLPRPDEVNQRASAPSIWNLDLRVRAENEVFISGMGLESEWSTDLRVQGTTSAPRVVGSAEVIRGTYGFAGNRFELTRGEVTFDGATPINPRLNIVASGDVSNVTININIGGSATDPQIAFTSTPALPQDELLARLLFGGPVNQLSALQAVQLASSLNSLRGGGGGLNPLGKLRSATGAARLRVLGSDQASGRSTAVAAGFYLSNDIYLEVVTDARGFTATQLEIALSRTLSILSQAGSFGGSNASIRYRKEY